MSSHSRDTLYIPLLNLISESVLCLVSLQTFFKSIYTGKSSSTNTSSTTLMFITVETLALVDRKLDYTWLAVLLYLFLVGCSSMPGQRLAMSLGSL